MRIHRFLSILVSLVYKSMFLSSEDNLRRSHLVAKILFILSMLYIVNTARYDGAFLVIAMCFILTMFFRGASVYIASLVLSTLPATWLALSALFLQPFMTYSITYGDALLIFVKTLAASQSIIFFISALSPVELANIIAKISPRAALYPIVTWRLIPLALKDVTEALMIQSLKNEDAWRALAVAIASQFERTNRIEEANIYRLEHGLLKPVPRSTSLSSTLILVVAPVLAILVIHIF